MKDISVQDICLCFYKDAKLPLVSRVCLENREIFLLREKLMGKEQQNWWR